MKKPIFLNGISFDNKTEIFKITNLIRAKWQK